MLDLVLGAELEAAQVRVAAHLLDVDLLGVVNDLSELGRALLRPGEDVAPAAPQPGLLVKAEQCGVHPDAAAPLIHPVFVTGEHVGHQGHPAGELPGHLNIKVWVVL